MVFTRHKGKLEKISSPIFFQVGIRFCSDHLWPKALSCISKYTSRVVKQNWTIILVFFTLFNFTLFRDIACRTAFGKSLKKTLALSSQLECPDSNIIGQFEVNGKK